MCGFSAYRNPIPRQRLRVNWINRLWREATRPRRIRSQSDPPWGIRNNVSTFLLLLLFPFLFSSVYVRVRRAKLSPRGGSQRSRWMIFTAPRCVEKCLSRSSFRDNHLVLGYRVSGTQARQSYLLRLSLFPILLLYYNFFGRFFLRACSEFSSLLLKHDFPRSNLTGNFFDAVNPTRSLITVTFVTFDLPRSQDPQEWARDLTRAFQKIKRGIIEIRYHVRTFSFEGNENTSSARREPRRNSNVVVVMRTTVKIKNCNDNCSFWNAVRPWFVAVSRVVDRWSETVDFIWTMAPPGQRW